MASQRQSILTSFAAAVSERLRDAQINTAIMGCIAVLGLTVWTVSIAGLVVLMAPLWGVAAALFFVALMVAVFGLALLYVLNRRARVQRARATLHKAEMRRKGQEAVLLALPSLLRHRSGALVVASGLAIGALIVSALPRRNGD